MLLLERNFLLVWWLLATIQHEACSNDLRCPSGKTWMKTGQLCARVRSTAESWRAADTNCRMSKGRSVRMANNSEPMDEWLEENRRPGQDSGLYWTGAHVPALTLASYFDRCLTGFHRGGVCYQVVTSPMTWQDASSYCSDSGGGIVHVDDEATSRFVETVAHDALQRFSSFPEDTGYWIDGRSVDDLPMVFADRFGMVLNYTNLEPSIVFDATLLSGGTCLEVVYNGERASVPPFSPTYPMSAEGIQQGSKNDHQEAAPQYRIQKCDEKRVFLCEYALEETIRDNSDFEDARALHKELKSKSEEEDDGEDEGPTDYSHLYSPSRIRSCEEIVILSDLAREMKSNMATLDESLQKEMPLMDVFSYARNGYYIMPRSNAVDGVMPFTLEYCDLEATRDALELNATTTRRRRLFLYLHMFKWSKFDYIDDDDFDAVFHDSSSGVPRQSFVEFNRFPVDQSFAFFGPCVFLNATDEKGYWHSSPCLRSLPYICEYPPKAAEEVNQEEENAPMAQLGRKIEEFDVEFGGKMDSLDPQGVSAAFEILETIVEAGGDSNGSSDALSAASYEELESLLMRTLPIVDALQSPSTTDADVEGSAEEYVAVRAVNTLAENLADRLLEERSNNEFVIASGLQELNYKTNTSEVRIVLTPPNADYSNILEATTFRPDEDVEAGTQITITPPVETVTGDTASAFVFAVHSPSSKQHQQTASVKMNPSFVTTSNGRTHFKLVRLDEDASWRVATPIVTATLRMNGKSVPVPVRFRLPKFHFTDVLTVNQSEICSYLVYSDQETVWSDSGCHESRTQEEGVYQCACNHTTDFAVLLLVYTPADDFLLDHRTSIFILTVFGESMSALSLIVTALAYFVLRNLLKSDRIKVHLHLVVALLTTHTTLLVSQIWQTIVGDDVSASDVMCTSIAFVLHFGLLASFCWMLVEGFILYKKILVVLTRETPVFQRKYNFVAWLLPFLVVLLSFAICWGTEIPYNDKRCWLAVENGVIWSFAAPAMIVWLINMVILVRVLCVAVATKHRRNKRKFATGDKSPLHELWFRDFKVAARGVAFLTPLLGVTWVFGFLSGTSVVFAYAFIFCNAFQGFYLFLFYVPLNPEVRSAWEEKKRLRERDFLVGNSLSALGMCKHTPLYPQNNADLPKLPAMERKSWFRRVSTSLLTRLSPTTPDASGNVSPNFEKALNNGDFNGVDDFVGSSLPSRPSSGKSMARHMMSLAVSLTSLRQKSARVCPEVSVAVARDCGGGADWTSGDQSEAAGDGSSVDEVFCDDVVVEDEERDCGCLHHLSSGSCGEAAVGYETGKRNPCFDYSCEETLNELSAGKGEVPLGEDPCVMEAGTAVENTVERKQDVGELEDKGGIQERKSVVHTRRQVAKQKCCQSSMTCQSRLCTICNKNPKALHSTSSKPQKRGKAKQRVVSSKRPATAGNCTGAARRRGPKAKQKKRGAANRRFVLEAWSTKMQSTSLDVLETGSNQFAVDDLIGHLEFESLKAAANGRPQSSESHDSGIGMAP